MLNEIMPSLELLTSDFGTLLLAAVAFWLVLGLLPLLRTKPRRTTLSPDVVRSFRLPSRGGRG